MSCAGTSLATQASHGHTDTRCECSNHCLPWLVGDPCISKGSGPTLVEVPSGTGSGVVSLENSGIFWEWPVFLGYRSCLFDYPGVLWQVAVCLCWVSNIRPPESMTHLRLRESSVATLDGHANLEGRGWIVVG